MTNQDGNDFESVKIFIDTIHKDYEIWYAKVCRLNYRIWYSLQLITLLSGFLTSIFVAFQTQATWTPTIKIICIIIPLIGSLAATIVLQFKVFETWKLREEGRISFQNLVNFSRSQLLKCKSQEDFQKLHEEISLKTNEIENEQSNKFFSLYGSNFIASYATK
ncbi:DUF4231 domain-containing protein [Aquiflexum gelatinilyticum]|uniref:DUF4231 domain-containing protein n=1 Tax=Aquiflexum gelatinilyticum TaxID=2961943 RepID=UPI002168EA3B|nr:DUF4231 domain-containing protein [Aquiflexum gelatinilyticum]MCS4435212.1 DUF4231 domain-containing protein [Aquiflexum gelatinilyticum]